MLLDRRLDGPRASQNSACRLATQVVWPLAKPCSFVPHRHRAWTPAKPTGQSEGGASSAPFSQNHQGLEEDPSTQLDEAVVVDLCQLTRRPGSRLQRRRRTH